METKSFNSDNSKNQPKSNKKNFAVHAGTAAVGAGFGAMGAAMAGNINDSDDIPEAAIEEEIPEQPQDITTEEDITPVETEHIQEQTVEPEPEQPTPQQQQPTPQQPTDEPVNPDDIADAIIAEEQIDPNDIDVADVINFDEIGTVYTVSGESYTAAAFHDPSGNEMMMVDVDGDEIFDVITNTDGELVADDAGGMTVSDAEIMINDDSTYLAHTDTDDQDLPDGESFMNDIINA